MDEPRRHLSPGRVWNTRVRFSRPAVRMVSRRPLSVSDRGGATRILQRQHHRWRRVSMPTGSSSKFPQRCCQSDWESLTWERCPPIPPPLPMFSKRAGPAPQTLASYKVRERTQALSGRSSSYGHRSWARPLAFQEALLPAIPLLHGVVSLGRQRTALGDVGVGFAAGGVPEPGGCSRRPDREGF